MKLMKNTKSNFLTSHVSRINELIHALEIKKVWIFYLLPSYYLLTILNAFIDGLSMLLLVSIFTDSSVGSVNNPLLSYIINFLNAIGVTVVYSNIVYVLVVVFGINLLIRFSLLVFDGVLNAKLRRRLQEAIFRRILFGEWSCTRDSRVGDLVGTNTQEALLISKYLSSAISTVYFALSSLVMIIMSAITSLKVTFFLGLIALPFIFLMKKTFSIQAGLSKESALLRNNFSADITDRFNGLLQIHVDNNYGYHIEQGIRSQSRLTRLDVLIAYCQSVIGIFNLLLPFFVLIGFSLWIYFLGNTYKPNFPLIASVGFLGMKAVSQLNGMVASLGNLSRLSGSLFPVLRLLAIASINKRTLIQEEIIGIKLNRISYKYGIHKALNNINLRITKGSPLLLTGRSGKGKTTIGNLIAGLFYPSSGELMYEGASGKSYLSSKYRAKIGFVTQDIYLFQGTLRSNLTGNRKYADKEIWSALKQVDIFNFVKKIGGLDTSTLEAGRSLSGGQRRRLGIARALLSGCDILIFDEILSGLDKKNKIAITKLINKLSYKKILIMISHDEILLNKKFTYNIK
jgi:ABC-type transport system involved in cytochrome bd biosynthesis fused ATPase/permease subunit